MRDYLEELLDLLTQETEEEAAGVWETQTASLILPKALEAEAPEGALELPEGMAAKGVSSGDGGDRPWLERGTGAGTRSGLGRNRDCAGAGRRPGPGGGAFGFHGGAGRGACLWRGAACHGGRMGRRRPARFCRRTDQEPEAARSAPAGAGSGAAGGPGAGPGSGPPEPLPGIGSGPFPRGDRSLSLSDGGGERRADKAPAGRPGWAERIRSA